MLKPEIECARQIGSKVEVLENRFPNNEFQNMSLNERNGGSSGDEGDRSSSDDEKCSHECHENEEFLCDLLTEECLVDSLINTPDNEVQIKPFYYS